MTTRTLFFTALGMFCGHAVASEHWPQFRGPNASGVSTNANLPDKWSATENVAWKTDLPGRSWSSPIVWGDRVFITAVVNSGESEAPKKGLYFGGERPEPSKAEQQWKVLCLDLTTGKMQWEKPVHRGAPRMPIHLKSSYGAETPVTDGERVYALFGGVGVFAFTLDGGEAWFRRLEPRKMRYGWGSAASPVLHGGRMFIVNDNDDQAELFALDAKTGKLLYDRERLPNGFAFTSSPWAAAGRIFCLNEDGVCYVLRAGDRFEWLHTNKLADDDMCMTTPALAGDRLLIRTAARLYCLRQDWAGRIP